MFSFWAAKQSFQAIYRSINHSLIFFLSPFFPPQSPSRKKLSRSRKNPTFRPKFFLISLGRPLYYLFLGFFLLFSILTSFRPKLKLSFPRFLFPKLPPLPHFSPPRLPFSSFPPLPPLPQLQKPRLSLSLPSLSLPPLSLSLPRPRFPHLSFFRLSLLTLLCFLSSGYLLFLFYNLILKDLPSPESLQTTQPKLTTQIFDRHGTPLYKLYQDENRTLVSLDQIPLHVRQATIAIEDKTFYQHQGLSLWGIFRAFSRNLSTNRLEGGSTITQQLIKNTLLTRQKTLVRKIKEVILAVHTELIYDKDTILLMYLNQVAYGGTAYGIQAAAQEYFGKNVADLTLAQAALLSGLPQAPTRYSPFGTSPNLARQRQLQVLDRLLADGYITTDQYQQAVNEKLVFSLPTTQILAPHFVMYVKDLLVNYYGETLVNQGGLQVHTTLDLGLQNQVQKLVTTQVDQLKNLQVSNGASLVLEPKTGQILAMVGSRDYFDLKNDGQVNLTLSPRQPGSAVKPITYALAFEKGATPSAIIADSPVTFATAGSPPWSPKNYDDRFHGPVTLKSALANSYNIPAVKLLASLGVSQMAQLGTNLGITTWNDPSRYGLSLTLGSNEVRMLDLARVYATFANLGQTVEPNPILSVTDYQGNPLPFSPCLAPHLPRTPLAKAQATDLCTPKQTLNPSTAYLISDILSDPAARAPAFGQHSILNIPGHQVAVKTGTSNNLRDNWTFGYTADFVVATWVGNNDNTPMHQIASGITGASPLWAQIFIYLLKDKPAHHFDLPDSLVKLEICTLTGTLPCRSCPSIRTEIYPKDKQPTTACTDKQIQQILEQRLRQQLDSSTQLTQQTVTPTILDGASTTRKKRRP